jgi:hypothetical protein
MNTNQAGLAWFSGASCAVAQDKVEVVDLDATGGSARCNCAHFLSVVVDFKLTRKAPPKIVLRMFILSQCQKGEAWHNPGTFLAQAIFRFLLLTHCEGL